MSNRKILVLTGLTLLAGTVSGWAIQESALAQVEMPEEAELPAEPAPTLGDVHGPALPPAIDGTEETTEPEAIEDDEVAVEEEPEPLDIRIPAAAEQEEGEAEDGAEDETPPETRLEAAERRIVELEDTVMDLEDDIDLLSERLDAVEELLSQVQDLGDAYVQDETARQEALGARSERAAALAAVEAELRRVDDALQRGNHAGASRPIGAAERRVAALGEEAERFGQLVEADRLAAASQALRLSVAALERRDLHEARTALGLALTHIQTARTLTRTDLRTP